MVEQLQNALPGAVRLPEPLPEPPHLVAALLDGLVVLDDVDSQKMDDRSPLPLPRYRGATGEADAWVALPYGGPERIVITGLATAAEQGLKGSRRGAARDARPGGEIFQTLCRMMAGGARTILRHALAHGRPDEPGACAEFTQELSQVPAAEAWGRRAACARSAAGCRE